MNISNLYLFAKDTDATATEQGYQYQKLKTLQTWLKNRVEGIDEDIYCDYEEDIFSRNTEAGTSLFKQVKLYSSNFSFSREEIQKSLAHFFMLYVKGDYLFDDMSFMFDTNSSIAKEYKENDANLLREWVEHQDDMSDELVERCRTKVKAIIDEYIKTVYESKLNEENKPELQKAKNLYGQLTDEYWNKFIKSIRWNFESIPQDKAILELIENIQTLITQLPLPLLNEKVSEYLSVLHFEIAQRTAQPEPEQRVLTNSCLDLLLLNMGSGKDKWYSEVYAKWQEIKEIKHFGIGAFYEAIDAAIHCRWHLRNSTHEILWKNILHGYIQLEQTIPVCKKKAIYEYLWLLLMPEPSTGNPKGSLDGQQEIIRMYFKDFSVRNNLYDIEDDITLLQNVQTHTALNTGFLPEDEINLWSCGINVFLTESVANAKGTDELCILLELQGHYEFHTNFLKPLEQKVQSSISYYRQIIPKLKDAKIYNISRLNDQLGQILNMFLVHQVDEPVIEAIENFLDEIGDEASRFSNQHITAKGLVKRGVSYIENPSLRNYLKALDNFHKAKLLWYNEKTKEGFILSLINIGQVYAGLGMNIASKYYGLCGVWASVHFGDPSSFKRISDAYAMVFYSDFKQGVWISALDDFENYIRTRLEFKAAPPDIEKDSIFRKVLLDLSCILAATPKLKPELSVFIEFQKEQMGWVYDEYLKPLVEELDNKFDNEEDLRSILRNKLSDSPLNDLGATRAISFQALGILWRVEFKNTAVLNSIAEEYVSLLQIHLCEIGLSGNDLHLLETHLKIIIEEGAEYVPIEQQPSHDELVYKITLPAFDSKEQSKIQYHYAFLATAIKRLIQDLSLLKQEEFNQVFEDLYEKQKLGEKGLSINTYQKVYFNFLSKEDFEKSQRSQFESLRENNALFNIPEYLPPVKGLSLKYEKGTAIKNIGNRDNFNNSRIGLTLSEIIKDPSFSEQLNAFRMQGWLDWQISLALMNYLFSKKANFHVQQMNITDDKEREVEFEKEFRRLMDLEETETYKNLQASELTSPEFLFYLNKVPVDVLNSFDLENNMKFPNFDGVHDVLNKRFNFNIDDNQDNNPLKNL